MMNETIKELKRQMRRLDISQYTIAYWLGVSQPTVSYWLRGKKYDPEHKKRRRHTPSPDVLAKLVGILHRLKEMRSYDDSNPRQRYFASRQSAGTDSSQPARERSS